MPVSEQNIAFSAIFEERLSLLPGRDGFIIFGGPFPQHPAHRHRELEFNLVVRGTARYLMRDRQYRLRPGSLIWLFPEQDHVLLDRSPDYAHWIVCFTPDLVSMVCRTRETALLREMNPAGWFCTEISEGSAGRIGDLLTELVGLSPEENARFNVGLGYALLTAWSYYGQATAGSASGGENYLHPGVQTAVRLIRESVYAKGTAGGDLSLSEIAERCGLSPDHLSRLFRRDIGIPPVTFRNQERIRRFIELYRTGKNGTMLDVALTVGFGSYAQFHRVFCEQMGISPQEYRRLWRDTPAS